MLKCLPGSQDDIVLRSCTFSRTSLLLRLTNLRVTQDPGASEEDLIADFSTWFSVNIDTPDSQQVKSCLDSEEGCHSGQRRGLPRTPSARVIDYMVRSTLPEAYVKKCGDVRSWGVEQVLAFFEQCKFPTKGVGHVRASLRQGLGRS